MRYERVYIQYNDLVFDGFGMVDEYDASNVTFRVISHDRSFGHGSYIPFKRSTSFVESSSVSITLFLKYRKLPCEQRPFYRDFVVSELSKHGRLWAIQNDTLVWAYATVENYSELVEHVNGQLSITVDFNLYEGIWHKADKQKTFLHPYDICTFMECYDYKEYQPCRDAEVYNECCDCLTEIPRPDPAVNCCECDCDRLDKYMALCYHLDELQDAYKYCSNWNYRVIYDCSAAERFFGRIGQKICTDNCSNGIIAGKIYSETDIPTEGVKITLVGKMDNPSVSINGNTNYIEGEYDGTLVINSNGDVFYENGCCSGDPLDPSIWKYDAASNYGWTIKPRNNRVVVNLGACCGKACAYFDIDNITI